MGRKKISLQVIADERSRSITFQKRRTGIMKKAMELSMLCDSTVLVLVYGASIPANADPMDPSLERNIPCYKFASNGDFAGLYRRSLSHPDEPIYTNSDLVNQSQQKPKASGSGKQSSSAGADNGSDDSEDDDFHPVAPAPAPPTKASASSRRRSSSSSSSSSSAAPIITPSVSILRASSLFPSQTLRKATPPLPIEPLPQQPQPSSASSSTSSRPRRHAAAAAAAAAGSSSASSSASSSYAEPPKLEIVEPNPPSVSVSLAPPEAAPQAQQPSAGKAPHSPSFPGFYHHPHSHSPSNYGAPNPYHLYPPFPVSPYHSAVSPSHTSSTSSSSAASSSHSSPSHFGPPSPYHFPMHLSPHHLSHHPHAPPFPMSPHNLGEPVPGFAPHPYSYPTVPHPHAPHPQHHPGLLHPSYASYSAVVSPSNSNSNDSLEGQSKSSSSSSQIPKIQIAITTAAASLGNSDDSPVPAVSSSAISASSISAPSLSISTAKPKQGQRSRSRSKSPAVPITTSQTPLAPPAPLSAGNTPTSALSLLSVKNEEQYRHPSPVHLQANGPPPGSFSPSYHPAYPYMHPYSHPLPSGYGPHPMAYPAPYHFAAPLPPSSHASLHPATYLDPSSASASQHQHQHHQQSAPQAQGHESSSDLAVHPSQHKRHSPSVQNDGNRLTLSVPSLDGNHQFHQQSKREDQESDSGQSSLAATPTSTTSSASSQHGPKRSRREAFASAANLKIHLPAEEAPSSSSAPAENSSVTEQKMEFHPPPSSIDSVTSVSAFLISPSNSALEMSGDSSGFTPDKLMRSNLSSLPSPMNFLSGGTSPMNFFGSQHHNRGPDQGVSPRNSLISPRSGSFSIAGILNSNPWQSSSFEGSNQHQQGAAAAGQGEGTPVLSGWLKDDSPLLSPL